MNNRINMHELRLNEKPFSSVKYGNKRIEMRLLDEKRSLYKTGDVLIFKKRSNENEIIKAKIINLYKFPSFEDLYNHFDKEILGYNPNEEANSKDMDFYYSKEDQIKYGVLGIEIELI